MVSYFPPVTSFDGQSIFALLADKEKFVLGFFLSSSVHVFHLLLITLNTIYHWINF